MSSLGAKRIGIMESRVVSAFALLKTNECLVMSHEITAVAETRRPEKKTP